MGAPSRLSPACVAQASAAVVPGPQRTTALAVPRALARRAKTRPPVGRRAVS